MKNVYDTGKVKIGLLYQEPRYKYYNPDQDWIQDVLLGERRSYMTYYYFDFVTLVYFIFALMCLVCTSAYGIMLAVGAKYD